MTRVREREVTVKQTAFLLRADEFFLGHSRKADAVVVVDDPLELVDGLHELGHLLAIAHFLRQDRATAKRGEIALPSHALARRFGEEEVAGMVEEGSFVEVAFGGASKEAQLAVREAAGVALLDEPILFVHDGEVGQHLDGLVPRGMHRLVFCRGDGEEFGQLDTEGDGDVGIFRDDAPLLDSQQRELGF